MSTSVLPGARPDRPEEECAVFGVFAPGEDVARMTCFGLQALQHRGQESAGIAVGDGETMVAAKDLGLVTQVFDEATLAALEGFVAVGHVRYSTSGGAASWEAAQPHISAIDDVLIALAHNGTLVNTNALRARLAGEGVQLRAGTDSEAAAKLIGQVTRTSHHLREGIRHAMQAIEGAYAMVLASPDSLYAFRDPNGIRPLCIGALPDGRGWVVSSETCGLDIVGAHVRARRGAGRDRALQRATACMPNKASLPAAVRSCIFEYVVLRPSRQHHRRAERLPGAPQPGPHPGAGGSRAEADLVLGVPDSGVPLGARLRARAAAFPYADGIVKNRYVGRTFIEPTQAMRQLGIRLKLNPLPSVIGGKRIVVIDDSIVRGNTSKKLVQMLRDAGATEVHLRIVSPEVRMALFLRHRHRHARPADRRQQGRLTR